MSGASHAGQPDLPLLVLVSWPPARGKSTLARRLALALGLPLLPRDPIAKALAETLGVRSPEARQAVTAASFAVFYRLLGEHLRPGPARAPSPLDVSCRPRSSPPTAAAPCSSTTRMCAAWARACSS